MGSNDETDGHPKKSALCGQHRGDAVAPPPPVSDLPVCICCDLFVLESSLVWALSPPLASSPSRGEGVCGLSLVLRDLL